MNNNVKTGEIICSECGSTMKPTDMVCGKCHRIIPVGELIERRNEITDENINKTCKHTIDMLGKTIIPHNFSNNLYYCKLCGLTDKLEYILGEDSTNDSSINDKNKIEKLSSDNYVTYSKSDAYLTNMYFNKINKSEIHKSFENEVKVFGLDENKIIDYLNDKYISSVSETIISIYENKHGDKVKILRPRNNTPYIQFKSSISDYQSSGKVKMEHNMELTNIFQTTDLLRFLKFNIKYQGIKKRIQWDLDKDIHITYDSWVSGPINGVSYFEIESTNKKVNLNFDSIVNQLKEISGFESHPVILPIGTMRLVKLYNKYSKSLEKSDDYYSFVYYLMVYARKPRKSIMSKLRNLLVNFVKKCLHKN